MESLMLERHNQHPRNAPVDSSIPGSEIVVQPQKTRTNSIAEGDDVLETRPIFVCFRDFRMRLCNTVSSVTVTLTNFEYETTYVTMIGIVDMWVNATLSITSQISRYRSVKLGLAYLKNNRIDLGLRVRLTQGFAHEHIQEPAKHSPAGQLPRKH